MFRKTASIFAAATLACGSFAVHAAGFDGMTLATNDWFDASFTALTADTSISQGDTTGITLGAGSWTAVPATGVAKIVADATAGNEATCLYVEAPGEELTLTPAALQSATGMETVASEVCTDAVDELPSMDAQTQAAFTIYSDNGAAPALMGYVSGGWTNLVYAAGADTLTNAWFTLYLDFATVSNVRYVRFSVKPAAAASATVLADSEGTEWFPAAVPAATTVNSVSLMGVGSCRTLSGDSLEEVVVATCNGVNYPTVAAAVAAAEDGDTVTLVNNPTASESIAVTKNVTINGGGNSNYRLNVASLDIAIGKTVTFINFASQNTIGVITGGGNIATSGNRTFRLKISGSNYTIGEIALGTTQGIRVEGEGVMTVSKLSATASSVLDAFDGAQITIDEVDSDSDITVSLKLVNATALTKRGDGVLTLAGVMAPTAGFVVEGGSVVIDNSMDGISPYVWVDASDESTITEAGGKVTEWASRVNGHSYTNEASAMTYESAEDVFGGKKVVRTNNSLLQAEFTGDKVQSAVAAIRYYSNSSTGGILYKKNVSNNYIGKRNSGNDYWSCLRTSSTAVSLWQNGGTSDIKFRTYETVLTVAGYYNGNATIETIGGTSGDIAIAEFVGFNTTDTGCAVRKRTEAYLGNKWAISGMVSLPSSVPLTLAGGTTFGLMGLDRTVDSVTVTGTGTATVTGGALTITAPVSIAVGQTLVIPYGSTYTLASGTGATVDTTAGTVTLKHCAADIDGVVYDIVADAIEAYESGILTIHESATLDLGTVEVNVANVVLDDGVVLTFTQNAPWTATYDGTAGTIVNTRVASTYVWTPGENETAWATLSNWRIGAAAPIALPGESDTVQFPGSEEQEFTGWTVVLDARQTIGAFVANTNVAISGAQICSPSYSGEGKLTLGNGAGFYVNAETTIGNDLEIAGSVSVTPSTTYLTTRINGNLTGSGTLTLGGTRPTHVLAGDNSGFTGTIVAPKDAQDRNAIQLTATSASSESAIWDVQSSGADCFTKVGSGTFKFGSLKGSVKYSDQSNYKYQTIEVGHLGLDDVLGGQWFPETYKNLVVDSNLGDKTDNSNRGHVLRKVGAGTLSFSGKYLRKYEINGGTLLITADEAFVWTKDSSTYRSRFTFGGGTLAFGEGVTGDPSSRIVGSAAPICFSNAVNEVHAWATALASSNAGGLVKKGEGTLVLAEAPLYTGDTYLDGGTLKIPATWTNKVKTHVPGKSVRKSSETIGEVEYTVYTLGALSGTMMIMY